MTLKGDRKKVRKERNLPKRSRLGGPLDERLEPSLPEKAPAYDNMLEAAAEAVTSIGALRASTG
ncbi:MAG: hypothetical protein LBW85_02595 [Deltaproteobacteria bacterium]|jgi:hypothetical protein|nr:hypothetical protein [Deltaproteobacteria bacterium]